MAARSIHYHYIYGVKVGTEKIQFWPYFGQKHSKKCEIWEFDKTHVDGSLKT